MHEHLLLADVQKAVGYVLAVLVILGFAIAVVLNMRKGRAEVGSEIELAANRKPYLEDDELETKKLDRTLGFGLVVLCVIAVALPLYWLAEPGRQADAIDGFEQTFVTRGEDIYVNGAQCASCHGPEGVGGVANYTITDPSTGDYVAAVSWQAPALDTVMYRYTPEQVKFILNYGRGYSPMPAWGAPAAGRSRPAARRPRLLPDLDPAPRGGVRPGGAGGARRDLRRRRGRQLHGRRRRVRDPR